MQTAYNLSHYTPYARESLIWRNAPIFLITQAIVIPFNACRFVMCFLPKLYGQTRLITLDTYVLYLSGYTPVYGPLAITQVKCSANPGGNYTVSEIWSASLHSPISLSSRTASTLSTTGSVLALPAHFRFKVYHPCLSQHFSSSGSEYPVTLERSFGRLYHSKTY